jgi:hypothetical protein
VNQGLVICSAIMRDLLASTAFQIANSEIRQVKILPHLPPTKRSLKPVLFRQVTGRSAGQAAMEAVFRNFSDYVEKKEKAALEVEYYWICVLFC